MWQILGRFAIGWGTFLAVPCLVLLFVLDRGTAEFAVTLLTLCMGVVMLLSGVALVGLVKYRGETMVSSEPRVRRRRR
jgi:hypothetical protein